MIINLFQKKRARNVEFEEEAGTTNSKILDNDNAKKKSSQGDEVTQYCFVQVHCKQSNFFLQLERDSDQENVSANDKKKKADNKDIGKPTKIRNGFEKGLEAEKILGISDSTGQILFLMKWRGSDETEVVTAKEANIKCPQVVIKFYEQRIKFPDGKDDSE